MKTLATCFALLALSAIAADVKDAARLPEGEGKAVVTKVCFDCHNSNSFRRFRYDKDGWSDQVLEMVDRGAKATPEEVNTIVDYLVKNFGPESKVLINSAPLAEMKILLHFNVPEGQAIMAYVEKNGPIKNFEELIKIPGVIPEKAEAVRAKIAF